MTPGPASAHMEGVIDYLQARFGLFVPPEKRKGAETRLYQVMAAQGLHGPLMMLDLLRTNSTVLQTVIDEFTVGETYFFRDPDLFALIRKTILPALQEERAPDAPLRLWSAGCATGEEAYSLAILLEEEGMAARADILATDISESALEKARAAVYGPWSLRGEDAGPLAARYFLKEGERYSLADRIRARVRFRYLNLASDFRPLAKDGLTRMDLILCRNVLIYLDEATTRAVAQRLFDCLAEGGWLLTGPSDPPLWSHAPYQTLVTSSGVLYRRARAGDQREAMPPAPANQVDGRRAGVSEDARWSGRVRWDRPRAKAGALQAAAQARHGAAAPVPAVELAAIRALADQGNLAAAQEAARAAMRHHPLSVELWYLLAFLALADGKANDAVASLRRLIYIDPGLAAAHMLLGAVLKDKGEAPAARRAFETAFALCAGRPEQEKVPLLDGETCGHLAQIARRQLEQIPPSGGAAS